MSGTISCELSWEELRRLAMVAELARQYRSGNLKCEMKPEEVPMSLLTTIFPDIFDEQQSP